MRMIATLPDILDRVPADGMSLDGLAALANQALDAVGVVVADGRACDHVDGRTIRFYQTLGIVPKPAYEGRRAIYDREHLVRVVAAKQLQSEGYSLAQIQSSLPSQSSDELAAALLALDVGPHAGAAEPRVDSPAPRAATAHAAAHPAHAPHLVAPIATAPPAPVAPILHPLATFQLAQGVLVLIDPSRVANPASLALELAGALSRSAAVQSAPLAAAPMTMPHGGKDRVAEEPMSAPEPRSSQPPSEPPSHGGNR